MGKGGGGAGGAGMGGGGGSGGRGGGGGGAAGSAVRVCVFDSRRGKREGEEAEKLLFFFPPATPPSEQVALLGLWEGLLAFTRIFSPHRPCEVMRAHFNRHVLPSLPLPLLCRLPPSPCRIFSPHRPCEVMRAHFNRHVLLECEPGIFMVLVVECRGVNGIVPPDATVRDEALRQYLVEAHGLFCLFFGSINRLLQQQQPHPPPPLPSEATTGPSSNTSSDLESSTPSHDSPSAVPLSADLARACLQAFLPDFLTEPSALAFPFALSAPTTPRVRLPALLDSLSNRLSCRQLNLSRSLTLPALASNRLRRAGMRTRGGVWHAYPTPPRVRMPALLDSLSNRLSNRLSYRLSYRLSCRQLNLPRSLTLPSPGGALLPFVSTLLSLKRLPPISPFKEGRCCRFVSTLLSLKTPPSHLAFQGGALLLCHNLFSQSPSALLFPSPSHPSSSHQSLAHRLAERLSRRGAAALPQPAARLHPLPEPCSAALPQPVARLHPLPGNHTQTFLPHYTLTHACVSSPPPSPSSSSSSILRSLSPFRSPFTSSSSASSSPSSHRPSSPSPRRTSSSFLSPSITPSLTPSLAPTLPRSSSTPSLAHLSPFGHTPPLSPSACPNPNQPFPLSSSASNPPTLSSPFPLPYSSPPLPLRPSSWAKSTSGHSLSTSAWGVDPQSNTPLPPLVYL
ncbi:unnamed protein product, partial [Closterium sp. NIES-65]